MDLHCVLVDTSVWIDFFRGSLSDKTRDKLFALLEADQIVLTNIIHHEILIGCKTLGEYQELDVLLSALLHFRIEKDEEDVFNSFAFKLKTMGLAGRYTDLTIAFIAHHHKLRLLSFDRYFEKLEAKRLIKMIHFGSG